MMLTPNQKLEKYKNDNVILYANFKEIPKIEMDYKINSEKDKVKTVKMIERVIRSSMEYRDYIKYLKEYIDMTHCSFFKNVGADNYSKISVEIHHSPFTLYDITMTVLLKHEDEYGEINLLDIAEEVMKLHYQCRVGLLPLSKTVHDLVHFGEIFIPVTQVRGNWLSFYKEYEAHMPIDMKDKIKKIVKFSKEVQDLSLLDTKYTYVNVDGFKTLNLVGETEFLRESTNPPKTA